MNAQQPATPAPATPPADPALPALPSETPPPATAAEPAAQAVLSGVPHTAQELSALRARREELSNQLTSATDRRNDLARQLRRAEGADRVGLEQRLQLLDHRILQLESAIAITGQQVYSAPDRAWTERGMPFGGGDTAVQRGVFAVGSLFTLLVFAPLAFAYARVLWRRASNPPARRDADTTQRLARLESAVDTIAEEVERMGEGQRFLTRLLSESHGGAEQYAAPATTEVAIERR